jgi:GAF domain-containing protein
MGYPIPDNEAARLAVLRSTGMLARHADPCFDDLCREAKERFEVPIAIISLVESDDQRFAAKCGLAVDGTSRDIAFCAHAIMTDEILVVPDARQDARFATNPLVTGEPFIVFYAGAPLVYGAGIRLGTICVIDTKSRTFSNDDQLALIDLAERIVGEIWAVAYSAGVLECTTG